ncbi:hypothetical protein T4D_1952 [Trichinella pseudospiralis]|uniref:Uncharacterized protein n=1 Tax=Trichinella pseudospiralis TaxID=6337 RepID=A0A0V1FLB6_TRIPS|nr:hypothetical protein T4D_1952 [Trichinella pseudospiralis]
MSEDIFFKHNFSAVALSYPAFGVFFPWGESLKKKKFWNFLSETNRVKYNTVSIIYSFKEVSMKSTRSCSNRQISFQAASFGKAGFVAHAVQSKEENFIIVFCIIGVCLKKTQQQQRQQQQQQIFMFKKFNIFFASLGDVGKVVPRYSLVNFAKLCCPCLRKKPIK